MIVSHKFACPCCKYLTLDEEPPGTYLICPVCYWEDDPVQYEDPDYKGGANKVALNQARHNFIKFRASSEIHLSDIREAQTEEIPKG